MIDLSVLELLAARLCHDLVGPVSAIGNGVELMADEDADFARDAIALVGDSARKANRRLQFYRFAYGFRGGGLAGPAPHVLATEFFADTSIQCTYRDAARELPVEQQKLACTLLAVAGEALPRGGRLVVDAAGGGLQIEGSGEGNGPSPEMRAALGLSTPSAALTSRTVGGFFAGLLADAMGRRLIISDQPGAFRIAAVAA